MPGFDGTGPLLGPGWGMGRGMRMRMGRGMGRGLGPCGWGMGRLIGASDTTYLEKQAARYEERAAQLRAAARELPKPAEAHKPAEE